MPRTIALTNPSFEANEGDPIGWVRFQWTPSAVARSVAVANAHEGDNIFYMGSLRNGNYNGVYQDFALLEAEIGDYVVFSAYGYNDGAVVLNLYETDVTIVYLDDVNAEISRSGSFYDVASFGSNTWERMIHVSRIPEDAVTCRVVIQATRIPGGSSFSNVWVDSAAAEIVTTAGSIGTIDISPPEAVVRQPRSASGDIGTINLNPPETLFLHTTQAGLLALTKVQATLRTTATGAILLAKSPAIMRATQMGLLVLAKGGEGILRPSPLSLSDQGRDQVIRQRLVNMYSEPTPQGPTSDARYGRPGLYSVAQRGGGPIRATFLWKGFRITVSGESVWFESTNIGFVPNDGYPVSYAVSEEECVIVTGGRAYYVTESDVSVIETASIRAVRDIEFLAGRFIYVADDLTGRFFYSTINDAKTVDGLNFASAESDPDPIFWVKVLGDALLFGGGRTVEWWFASTNPDAPYQRSRGRRYDTGSISKHAVQEVGGQIVFVGMPEKDIFIAGGVPQSVSNFDVADRLRRVPDTEIPNITAFNVSYGGHDFYVINLPDQGTWAYDMTTRLWAEWRSWGRDRFRVLVADENFLGDNYSGNIFGFDGQVFKDFGDPLERICSSFAAINSGTVRNFNLALMAKRGVGLQNGYGSDPVVEMRFSDEQDSNWSKWLSATLGRIGRNGRESMALWHQLGGMQPPGRQFEFRCTDPVPFTPYQLKINEERP